MIFLWKRGLWINIMKKLLLLDADVVIDLHSLELFENLKNAYDIYVTKKVFDEAKYFKKDGMEWPIDIKDKVVIVEDIEIKNLAEVNQEAAEARLVINPGEATCIAYLIQTKEEITLCLCDQAAIQLVAYMNIDKRCISLEQALKDAGHHKKVYGRHSKSIFKECVNKGKALRVLYKLDLT
jgi:hypothetical protein